MVEPNQTKPNQTKANAFAQKKKSGIVELYSATESMQTIKAERMSNDGENKT